MTEDYLNIAEKVHFDDSVSNISYHSYLPHNTLTINNSDEVRIVINSQDVYTRPSDSFLYIKGVINNHAKGHLTNNALAALFDEMHYSIANKQVDSIRNPGIACWMKLLSTSKKTYSYSNAAIDTDDNLKTFHSAGQFSGCIPLSLLMGIFDDFKKILVNVKQELVLKRSKDDKNCLLTTVAAVEGAAADVLPTIELKSIQWWMPHVTPSDSEKLTLQRQILQNEMLQIGFRSYEFHELPSFPQSTKHTWPVKTSNQLEKPRTLIFGFQTARDGQARRRSDIFDHCNIKNLKVKLNGEYYPYSDMNLDFANKEVAQAYESLSRLRMSYYEKAVDPFINRSEFIDKYPLIVVDTSKQNESIKEGVVDIKLEIETSANVAADTTAYLLIIHDKLYEYNPLTNEIIKL